MTAEAAMKKYEYLIGTKIHKWTVLRLDHSRRNLDAICQCECGTIKPVTVQNLIADRSKDCGCGRKKKMSEIRSKDLTGQQFGKLTVLEMLPSNNLQKRMCRCKCECGNEIAVVGASLTSGHTKSCGCLTSYMNMFISQLLSKKNIEYQQEYRVQIGEQYFRFDFYLPQYNLIIEYDGEQHFKPVRFCGDNEERNSEIFKKTQQSDQIKNQYCLDKHYDLLRIPYTERENVEEIIENHLQRLNDKGVK